MISSGTVALALLAGGALPWSTGGCAAVERSLSGGPQPYTETDYWDAYRVWTQEGAPFDFGSLESTLHVTATFESRDFRWAYVVRFAADHGIDTDERTDLLRASLADAERAHRFFITLAGENPREVALTSATGAWRVLLMDDTGRQVSPREIVRVSSPTASEKQYFPSISSQRTAYRLTFPVVHEDGGPTLPLNSAFAMLRLTGARGRVDLRWDFGD